MNASYFTRNLQDLGIIEKPLFLVLLQPLVDDALVGIEFRGGFRGEWWCG